MEKRYHIVLICALVMLASGSWLSLTREKQITDARVACGTYVTRQIGPTINLEASSQWPVHPRSEDTWLVQANYSLRGRYDAMWCQLRVLGSQFGLARLDSDIEASRSAP